MPFLISLLLYSSPKLLAPIIFLLLFHDGPRALMVGWEVIQMSLLYLTYFMPIVNFSINHPWLHKDTSVMRSESYNIIWKERYKFKAEFLAMPFSEIVISVSNLILVVFEPPKHGSYTRFTLPGMHFLLWTSP